MGGVSQEWQARVLQALGGGSSPKQITSRYLDELGTGLGNIDAKGNYAAEAKDFYCQPSPGEIIQLTRLIITVRDGGSLDTGSYGNGIALTNGIQVIEEVDGEERILTGQKNIITNADWGSLCYDVSFNGQGSGDEFLLVRWTFARSGQNLRLVGDNQDKLIVRLNDNFSNLTGHFFLAQGFIE